MFKCTMLLFLIEAIQKLLDVIQSEQVICSLKKREKCTIAITMRYNKYNTFCDRIFETNCHIAIFELKIKVLNPS